MNIQYLASSTDIRKVNHDLSVKTPGAQQCRVKHIDPVGRCKNDHSTVQRLQPIHFNKHGIQSLFAFVMSTADPRETGATDSIDFINKNHAGSIFASLIKHVTNAACADTDKHFDKIRTAD